MWDEALLSDTQEFLGFAAVRTNSLFGALSRVGVDTLFPGARSHVGLGDVGIAKKLAQSGGSVNDRPAASSAAQLARPLAPQAA
jgi:hypothetical protein